MLGEKLGDFQGNITGQRTLPADGPHPKTEVSFETNGTILGMSATLMGTYSSVVRPDGTLYGECPDQGALMTQDGEMATWTGTGAGRFTGHGSAVSVSSGDGGNPSPSGEEKVVVVWSRAEVPTRRAHKVRSEGALGVDTEVSKESIARAIGDSCARPDPTDRDRARAAHHFGQSGTRPRPRIFVVSPASGYQHDRTVVERDQLTSASSGVSPPAEAVLGSTFLGTGVPGGQLRRPHG